MGKGLWSKIIRTTVAMVTARDGPNWRYLCVYCMDVYSMCMHDMDTKGSLRTGTREIVKLYFHLVWSVAMQCT